MLLDIIAIIVSITTALIYAIQYFQVINVNKTTFEFQLYQDILRKYFIDSIPKARKSIIFNSDNMLDGFFEFSDILNEMRKDFMFLKYRNYKQYEILIREIQILDDYIVDHSHKKFMTKNKKDIFLNKIDNKIVNLYDVVLISYLTKHKNKNN